MDRRDRVRITPLERAKALDAGFFSDPAWLGVDEREILAKHWSLIGPASDLAHPGDHVVERLGRVPVLIVRGEDGVLRGFANVCRHRAGPVAACSGKSAKRFRCAYHGWIYDLEGRLRVAPEMDAAADFSRDEVRLPEIAVAEWNGLVFAAADPHVTAFSRVVVGLEPRLAANGLGALKFHARHTHEVACNWKVYVDNYLEGYHVPVVHPTLSAMVDYANYEIETGDWWSIQATSVRGGGDAYGDGEALFVFVFPNTMLNVADGRLQTNRVTALGADRCRVEFDSYYAPGADGRAAGDRASSDSVQEEDKFICERVFEGLKSGTYDAGRLSPKRERAVWHWHNLLRRSYAPVLNTDPISEDAR